MLGWQFLWLIGSTSILMIGLMAFFRRYVLVEVLDRSSVCWRCCDRSQYTAVFGKIQANLRDRPLNCVPGVPGFFSFVIGTIAAVLMFVVLWLRLFFRSKKKMSTPMSARPSTPPTTPPTIAPVLLLLEVAGVELALDVGLAEVYSLIRFSVPSNAGVKFPEAHVAGGVALHASDLQQPQNVSPAVQE